MLLDPPTPGVRLEVTIGGRSEVRVISAGGSYLSCSAPEELFGLGESLQVDRLAVRYPGGFEAEWSAVPAGRIVVREGETEWHALSP